jgi:tetratricopeptide (TPR) repeat protein
MKHVSFLLIIILIIGIHCGKKDVTVKSMEGLEPAELLQKGDKAFNEGNMDEAIEAYGIIYERYPTSREYIDAVIGMARSYNNRGDFESGFNLLYNLIRENMVPSRVPEIYNEMARYYEVTAAYSKEAGISSEQEDFKSAISFYTKSVSYPNSDDRTAKSYAQFQIGELQSKLGNYDDAALAYQSTLYNYSGTEWATLAEQRLTQLRQEGKASISPVKKETAPSQPEMSPAPGEEAPPESAAPDTSGTN